MGNEVSHDDESAVVLEGTLGYSLHKGTRMRGQVDKPLSPRRLVLRASHTLEVWKDGAATASRAWPVAQFCFSASPGAAFSQDYSFVLSFVRKGYARGGPIGDTCVVGFKTLDELTLWKKHLVEAGCADFQADQAALH